jgi:signal transduction histidine kinase
MDETTREVLRVAQSVLSDLDLERVLERVLHSARDLTGARYAAVGVLDESRLGLARFITLGIDDDAKRTIGALPRGRGVLGELIAERTPLRLDDVSRHPRSYGFPPGHPPMRSFLGVPIIIDEVPYGNLYLTDKQGADRFSEDDEEAVTLLADFAAVAIDHARLFTGSETRRAELQLTVDALDATIEISKAVGGQTDLPRILELVAKRGRALVSARALLIELVAGDELVFAEGAGELPPDVVGRRMPAEGTVASAALRSRETQWLRDELTRSRFEQHGFGQLGFTASDGLVVPLIFRNQAYGVLVAIDRTDSGQFTPEHARLLESFAASAATAVATAQSVAEQRRHQRIAATEAERARWARELHDETLQGLANLCLVLSTAQRDADPEAMKQAIAEAIEQLENDIANLRGLITDLRPAALDDLGVDAALDALAERAARTGIDVDVNVDFAYEHGRASDRLIPELEAAIYRIVQESLTNAGSHGAATRAAVEIVEDDRTITLVIRDNGQGFDTTAPSTGFGLAGMRERVELLHGTIEVTSVPGKGATITATLPAMRRTEAQALGARGLSAPGAGL